MAITKRITYQCDRCGSEHFSYEQGLKQGRFLNIRWDGREWDTWWDGGMSGAPIREAVGWLCSPCSEEFLRFVNSTEAKG